ncbi:hypothetical protein A3K63_05260 [Candidatus Micrarchaeota archaeon RBG_16_49_10]|nr:MAG: hypothetical protein A3K63_05260 [Candidatus Micrarchaeota archaeon RBG_16_49_10]
MPRVGRAKSLALDILSFGSPQAIIFNLSSLLLGLAAIPTKYLAYSPLKCVFKSFLLPLVFGGNCPTSGLFAGCSCPACGIARGISRLMHGDLVGTWNYNKLAFLVVPIMLALIAVNLHKSVQHYKKTGKIHEA